MKDNPNIRIAAHDKSSLAPEGKSIAFEIHPEKGFSWSGYCDTTADELLSGYASPETKTTQAESLLSEILKSPQTAEEIFTKAAAIGISERTVNIAKKNLGIVSEKLGNKWFWKFPGSRL